MWLRVGRGKSLTSFGFSPFFQYALRVLQRPFQRVVSLREAPGAVLHLLLSRSNLRSEGLDLRVKLLMGVDLCWVGRVGWARERERERERESGHLLSLETHVRLRRQNKSAALRAGYYVRTAGRLVVAFWIITAVNSRRTAVDA